MLGASGGTPAEAQSSQDKVDQPTAHVRSSASLLKRQRLNPVEEYGDPAASLTMQHKKCLACPFEKKHRYKYRECYVLVITRISDLKQHIRRKHINAYCPRCWKIFKDSGEQETHIRLPPESICPINTERPWDIITTDQQERLTQRVSPKLNVEEQWYSLWDVLFPGEQKPVSPYPDRPVSDDFESFRRFFHDQGAEILASQLEGLSLRTEQGLVDAPRERVRSSVLRQAVVQGFDVAIAHWLSETPLQGNRAFDDGA